MRYTCRPVIPVPEFDREESLSLSLSLYPAQTSLVSVCICAYHAKKSVWLEPENKAKPLQRERERERKKKTKKKSEWEKVTVRERSGKKGGRKARGEGQVLCGQGSKHAHLQAAALAPSWQNTGGKERTPTPPPIK